MNNTTCARTSFQMQIPWKHDKKNDDKNKISHGNEYKAQD